MQYEIEVVESFDESPDVKELLDTAEIRWIALYRQQELDLTNSSDGGGGRRGPRKTPVSEETRRRISEAKKGTPAWNKGKQLSAEYRKKLSENHRGMTGKKQTAETRAKISAALRRRVTSS
ncbi:NUMOD3 domain-containing DNA-binding protein [Anaeromyxobacter sp. PSR-1]|uniref:NUMOD3 domain-containing DNA-binding protein n=1 Tax=Anaeromyxobacter sp. PSR-1 TaxID=1300915 RepID=UPI000AD71A38|nr:NUMOD3 domain-containing DNA-binding protein [Anaeromyxobacter sp. PSR-1]